MSDLTDILARHRRQVDQRDKQALTNLIRAYSQVYERVQTDLERIQAQIAAAEAAGDTVGPSWLFQEQRLQLLERLVEREVGTFARFAGGAIEDEQRYFAALGQEHTRELVMFGLDPPPRGATVAFSYLPTEAIESLVGHLSDGSPLSDLLDELGPDASRAVRRALVQAVGTGIGPRETARMIRGELGGNLTRALRISRTEQIRSLHEASYMSAQRNSDVLREWVWTAHLGPRTCPACISMHGTRHPISERMSEHVSGRCTATYVTKTWAELGFKGIEDTSVREDSVKPGPAWFAGLAPATQARILGPSKYRAFQDGAIKIGDLVGVRQSRRWGDQIYEKSLRELVGVADARRFIRPVPVAPGLSAPPPPPAAAAVPNVSAALSIANTRTRVGTSVSRALHSIDSVHGDGVLPTIPLRETRGRTRQGAYWHGMGTAVRIEISSVGKHQELSAAHEVGHFLDHQALGRRGIFASSDLGKSPEMTKLMDAISSSRAITSLRDLRSGPSVVEATAPSGATVQYRVSRKYVDYLLNTNEQFARAYAQYIADRSGDATMREQLAGINREQVYRRQWEDDDFRPIGQAFDALFTAKGWKR